MFARQAQRPDRAIGLYHRLNQARRYELAPRRHGVHHVENLHRSDGRVLPDGGGRKICRSPMTERLHQACRLPRELEPCRLPDAEALHLVEYLRGTQIFCDLDRPEVGGLSKHLSCRQLLGTVLLCVMEHRAVDIHVRRDVSSLVGVISPA